MKNSDRFQLTRVCLPKNTALAVAQAFNAPLPPALGVARDNKTGEVQYPTIPMKAPSGVSSGVSK